MDLLAADGGSTDGSLPAEPGALRQKLGAYQANGAQLGWLLIPEQQAVEIWPASAEP